MSLKSEAIKRFLTAARSLANQGLSKEAIMQFAKNEFGEITELFQKQIDNIFKRPASGIEKIKIKDEVFDDTVIKLPVDDTGKPFNPRDPLKDYSKKPKDEDPGFYTGGMVDVEPNLSDIGHGSDALMARTRLVSPDGQATTSTGLNYLLAEDNDNIRVPFKDGLKVYPKIMASKSNQGLGNGKNVDLQDLTYGGTLMYDQGPFSAGIEYLKGKDKFDFKDTDDTLVKDTTDRELANLILMMKLKNGSIKFKGNKDNQMINLSKSFAQGGRIGFSKGKLADAARRKFMKTAGAAGAGIAALKTGLLGFADKAAPVAKEVIETVSETAQGVPPYFLNLVNKIRKMGESTLATKDKANAYKFKDYVMEEDFAGNIEIIKKGDDVAEDVFMSYKVDEVPVKKGGSSKVEEYEEYTARPDAEGKMKDIEQGVPDEVVQEGTIFEDTMSEFGKASGGIARMIGE